LKLVLCCEIIKVKIGCCCAISMNHFLHFLLHHGLVKSYPADCIIGIPDNVFTFYWQCCDFILYSTETNSSQCSCQWQLLTIYMYEQGQGRQCLHLNKCGEFLLLLKCSHSMVDLLYLSHSNFSDFCVDNKILNIGAAPLCALQQMAMLIASCGKD
jgi:hypothetical protein